MSTAVKDIYAFQYFWSRAAELHIGKGAGQLSKKIATVFLEKKTLQKRHK